ncbi:hypothetical protein RJT34_29651 [Clitoria ternatea]|uniref:Uncharacterized protein n=1 Tax=Clitoria ternatea TaxID=43366 RepID=A0AAN9I6K5_CLITE
MLVCLSLSYTIVRSKHDDPPKSFLIVFYALYTAPNLQLPHLPTKGKERFRQLQRVKEMRKEKELLKMLKTEVKHFETTFEPTRQFFHPELMSSPPHVSLSLWPTSQLMHEGNKTTIIDTPISINLCSKDCTHAKASWKNFYDLDSGSDSGVDTSLHL